MPATVRADTSPGWRSRWAATARTWRALTGRPVEDGPVPLVLVQGPDGQPAYLPAPPALQWPERAAGWLWRHRHAAAPLAAAPAYAVARMAGLDWRTTAIGALAAPAIAGIGWLVAVGGWDGTRRTGWLLGTWLAAMEAWLLLLPPAGLPLLTVGAVAHSSWRYRIRPAIRPAIEPADDRPWQVRLWESSVGGEAGRLLPDAALVGVEALTNPEDPEEQIGWMGGVQLVRGVQEVAHLRSRTGLIAGLYGAAKDGVVVEDVGDESRARLIVTVRRFLEEKRLWSGPTLDTATGRFVMQTLADGSLGYWQVWKPMEGVRHGWIIGATGGGKSGAADCLLASIMSRGICVLDLVDLKGGASLPHWQHKAFRFSTTPEDAIAALYRAVAVLMHRYDVMRGMQDVDPDTGEPVWLDDACTVPALGRTWIDPSATWALYLLFVEEWPQLVAHPILGKLALALAEKIAALGRQANVALYITSQGANLSDVFGNSRILRTNLQAGNVLILWTDQGSGNLATATRSVDLSRIPEGQAGVSYLVGPGQPRDVMGRVPWVYRKWDAVKAARPGELTRDEQDAAEVAEDAARLVVAQLDGTAAAPDAAAPAGKAPGITWAVDVLGADPAAPAWSEQQRKILTRLADGPATAAQLRDLLGGITDQGLRGHLAGLLDGDDPPVCRPSKGLYELSATTEEAAA